jgi:YVTN family beta-propeller protein
LPTQLLWARQVFATEAQPAVDASAQAAAVAQSAPVNLDLSSIDRTRTVSTNTAFESATIQVGAAARTITPGLAVTPAEYVAVMQVLKTGQQSIQLGDLGNAVGGTVNLSWLGGRPVDNLVVPAGVSALHDFAQSASLNVLGNLNNSGNVVAYSTNSQVTNAVVNAGSILNNQSALISSLPSAAAIAGVQSAVTNLNFGLNAVHDIVNAGSIMSSGSLNLNAGGAIVNALPSGVSGGIPVMQAVSSVNLMTGAGTFTNSGLVSAGAGNVNISSQRVTDMIVNSLGGRLEALSGAVNVREATFSQKASLSWSGGDVLAENLNLHSGRGVIAGEINSLTGLLNAYGGELHLGMLEGALNLGEMVALGDPSLFSVSGPVNISTSQGSAGVDLTIASGTNIVTTASGRSIFSNSGSGNAGNILLIAGANLTSLGGGAFRIESSSPTSAGGRIDLVNGSNSINSLTSTGGGSSGNGGNITLIAFAGSGSGAGTINLPTGVTITAGGSGTGNNGNVAIIAGATSGTGITIGPINTTGGTGGGGAILVTTATPSVPSDIDISSGGTATPGTNAISVGTVRSASISVGSTSLSSALVAPGGGSTTSSIVNSSDLAGGRVTVRNTGSTLAILGDVTATASASGRTGGDVVLDASFGGSSGTLDFNDTGIDLTANGSGSGKGGTFDLRGGTITSDARVDINANGGASGGGGTVSLTTTSSTGDIVINDSTGSDRFDITARGGSTTGDGGIINLSAGDNLTVGDPVNSMDARPQAGNGRGPTYSLAAGVVDTTGFVQIQASGGTPNIALGNLGTGAGGSLSISYKDTGAGNTFQVGGTSTNSYIEGTVTANSTGSTAGAAVSITNTSATVGTLIDVPGTLSTTAISGAVGTLNFTDAGQPISLAAAGTITGGITALGSSVTINASATNTALSLSAVTATAGAVSVTANSSGSSVTIPGGGSVSAAGASGDITLLTLSLTNNGTVSATTAGTDITVQSASGLSVGGNGSFASNATGTVSFLAMTAGSTLTVTDGTALTISGAGPVSLRAPNLTFVATTTSPSITATGASAVAINSGNSAANVNLTITAPSGFAGTVGSGGTINIAPTGTGSLTFANSGVSATTLHLNGNTQATTSGAQINVNTNVTVSTNNNLTFTTSGGTSGSTTSDIVISGNVQSSAGSGVVTLQSSTNLSVSPTGGISADQLLLSTTSGNNGNITLDSNITGTTSVRITANGSGSINFRDTTIATINGVGVNPKGVAMSPNNQYVYVVSQNSDSVSTIDTSTNTVVSTENLNEHNPPIQPVYPLGIAVTPDGLKAYVADNGNTTNNQTTVQILNLSNPAQPDVLANTITVGPNPHSIAITPDGRYAYVTNQGLNGQTPGTPSTVSVIDTTTDTVVSTITVGGMPKGLAVNPSGTAVYVANEQSNTISVIDTELALSNPAAAVIATIAVGETPRGVAANPAGLWVYVTNQGDDTMSVIDTSSNTVIATVAVGPNPSAVAVNLAGTLAYIPNQGNNTVSVVSTGAFLQIATPSSGAAPFPTGDFLGFIGNNNFAYIPNGGANSVSVLRFPTIITPSLTLGSTSGLINVSTTATSYSANTTGNVYLTASSSITAVDPPSGTPQNTGNIYQVGTPFNLTINSPINANVVILQNVLTNSLISVAQNILAAGTVNSPSAGPPAGNPPQYSALLIVAGGGSLINTASITSTSTGLTDAIQVQGQGALTLSGVGTFAPGVGHNVFIGAPVALTVSGTANQVATNGSVVIQAPIIQGANLGSGIVAASAGTISVNSNFNNSASLLFRPVTSGQTSTVNLNAGQVYLNSLNLFVSSALTISSTGIITANMSGTLLSNNGTFSSSANGDASANGVVVSFLTPGALTVAGTGTYTLSGAAVSGVVPQVQFATSGANALQVSGSNTFNLGVGGVNFMSQDSGASLTFASSTTQTMTTGGYIYVSSPTLSLPTGTVFNQSAAAGSTIAIDGGVPTSTFNLNLPSGTVTLLSGSFGTTIYPYNWNQSMNITSAGTTTLNINGGPVLFYTNGANQTIGSGVTIQSNDSIQFDLIGGGQFSVSGSILSTNASKQITVNGLGGGTITFVGSPQTIGGGAQSILLEADSMIFNSSYTFNASGGLVSILTPANNTGGITLANSITVKADGGSRLAMGATLFMLGTNSTIWSTATSGTAIDLNYIAPTNSGNMTLSLPGGSATTVNLQSNGGLISLQASGNLSFANPNGGTTTLNATGGSFFAENGAGAMTIATGLTVRGSSNMTFSLNTTSQFTDNGTITSTGSGATIRIQGGGATTTGNFVMAGTPQAITAPGGGSIVLQGFRPLVINSSYSFSTSGGSLTLTSPQSVTLASSITVQMTGSGQINLNTPLLSLGAGSTLSTGQTSGTGISGGIGFSSLTVNVPGGGIGTLLTSGAAINLIGASGMTLARTGVSGTATLRLNGGPASASVNSGTLSVGANFSLTSNAALTLNAPFATVSNSGTISGTAASGSTSTTINAATLSNAGTITGSSGAHLVVTNSSGGNLSVTGSGSLTAVGSSATVTISNNNAGVNASQGQISGRVIGTAGRDYILTTTSGSSLTVGNITASQGSVTITAGTPGSSTVLTVAGGSTINAFEGNVTLMNSDTTTGSIVVGAAATSTLVNAYTVSSNLSIGNVYIVVGAIPGSPANLDPVGRPANVTVNIVGGGKTTPGQVFWGASSITVNNPSTVNAFARKAVFNSSLGVNSIRLNGAVTIVADPPIPGATVIFAVLEPPVVAVPDRSPMMPSFSVGMTSASITPLDTLSGTSAKWYDSGDSLNNPVATDLQNKEERKTADDSWLGSTDAEEATENQDESDGAWQDGMPLQPISFIAPGAMPNQASPLMLHTLETASGLLKHTGRARVSHGEDSAMLTLRSGEALIAASKRMVVKCGQIKVSAQRGTYVLISRQGKVLKVRNLHETASNSVRVIVRDKYVDLAAGQEVILSTSEELLVKASKQDAIGRRRVKVVPLANGIKMLRSEISLVSLMQRNGTLATMLRSSDSLDKKIAGKVVKMAACLMYACSSHGSYSTTPETAR